MGWGVAVIPQCTTRSSIRQTPGRGLRCGENQLFQSPTFMSFTIGEVLLYTKDGSWATPLCPFGEVSHDHSILLTFCVSQKHHPDS